MAQIRLKIDTRFTSHLNEGLGAAFAKTGPGEVHHVGVALGAVFAASQLARDGASPEEVDIKCLECEAIAKIYWEKAREIARANERLRQKEQSTTPKKKLIYLD